MASTGLTVDTPYISNNYGIDVSKYLNTFGNSGDSNKLIEDYSLPGNMRSIYADSSIASALPKDATYYDTMSNLQQMKDNGQLDIPTDPGIFQSTTDWFGKNKDSIGTMAGLAGLGMNAYSQFFGQGKEAFDKQMKLYDQQIASNAEKMARRDALNKAWASTVQPTGLASTSYTTPKVG